MKEKKIFEGIWPVLIVVLLTTCVCTSAAERSDEQEINTGEDFTLPRRRFDIRQRVKQLSGDSDSYITKFRLDLPIPLDEGREGFFYYRMDVPFVASDKVGNDNPNGDTYEFGTGDLLTQFIYVPSLEVSEELPWDAFGFGARFIWPTASKSTLGSEKYEIAPLVGAKWSMPQISKGSWFAPAFRYHFSYADYGDGKDRDDISELAIQPRVYVNTREWGWPIDFVHFWASNDIRINFEGTSSKHSGDMFIPFDVMIGKMLNKNTVVSVDFAIPIVNDYDLYDWLVEFRIGFFF
jgi:hypothetical protein